MICVVYILWEISAYSVAERTNNAIQCKLPYLSMLASVFRIIPLALQRLFYSPSEYDVRSIVWINTQHRYDKT